MNVGTKKTKCYLTERIIQGAKTKIIISKNVKKEKFKLVGAAPVQSQENHQYITIGCTWGDLGCT